MAFLSGGPHYIVRRRSLTDDGARRCGFEQLEPRQLLTADVVSGSLDVMYGVTGGPTGSIAGNVFATTSTGCEAHLAAGLAEVRVQLLDDAGNVLEESRTDQSGAYRFADLIPGQYAVRQITPAGMFEGASHVGTGGGIGLGANRVGEIVVAAGRSLEGYDFCDLETAAEPSIPTDRRIVPHDDQNGAFRPRMVRSCRYPFNRHLRLRQSFLSIQ